MIKTAEDLTDGLRTALSNIKTRAKEVLHETFEEDGTERQHGLHDTDWVVDAFARESAWPNPDRILWQKTSELLDKPRGKLSDMKLWASDQRAPVMAEAFERFSTYTLDQAKKDVENNQSTGGFDKVRRVNSDDIEVKNFQGYLATTKGKYNNWERYIMKYYLADDGSCKLTAHAGETGWGGMICVLTKDNSKASISFRGAQELEVEYTRERGTGFPTLLVHEDRPGDYYQIGTGTRTHIESSQKAKGVRLTSIHFKKTKILVTDDMNAHTRRIREDDTVDYAVPDGGQTRGPATETGEITDQFTLTEADALKAVGEEPTEDTNPFFSWDD
ncbi:hypothetical protein TREMEDRAFT_65194 [Tremella mesenterica DSM 1558]|uniref:uncharacterized protein n=1 Tax=Tremella mesenterica (strain ATCC 24925 / CBS 8224 / DSM 1558 / NBRC 9311 / NRRL Y-6157 / RJB 2259-6 / UBC 559-6) TaxID=578456 RepID=UPI00032D3BFD|nr:uncharacterized protein TREMEDRAFT_65194 [Tremella mesenterica DSM 1558]EIW66792.1 hypothetical protein TREMEDRAFT_65194 [Tremella mesenterica DSM 1558]